MFDDVSIKNKIGVQRTQFNLSGKSDLTASPWSIFETVRNLTENYYKIELAESLYLAIQEGVDIADLFVSIRPLPITERTRDLDKLNLEANGLYNFYSIGEVIPLFPSVKGLFSKCLIDIYNKCLSFGFDNDFNGYVDFLHFHNAIMAYRLSDDPIVALNSLIENAKRIIARRFKTDKTAEFFEKLEQSVFKLMDACEREDDLEAIKKYLMTGQIEDNFDIEFFDYIEENYLKRFYDEFNKNRLPACLVLDAGSWTFKVLCRDNLINTRPVDSSTVLNIKNLSHNSPLDGLGEAAITSLVSLVADRKKRELEEQKLIKEIEEIELNLEEKRKNLQYLQDVREITLEEKRIDLENKQMEQKVRRLELILRTAKLLEDNPELLEVDDSVDLQDLNFAHAAEAYILTDMNILKHRCQNRLYNSNLTNEIKTSIPGTNLNANA